MKEERTFSDLLKDPDPKLAVKFSYHSEDESPTIVKLKNVLGSKLDKAGRKYLDSTFEDTRLGGFKNFYNNYDGANLFIPYEPSNCHQIPLLTFAPASLIAKFTAQYTKGGNLSYTMDYNKSKNLYRSKDPWVAFARIDNGPACLTTFLDGENAGSIFFATPQPQFNILKPIARNFDLLLARIVKDPAAFFRLTQCHVTFRKSDGQNYGYRPLKYFGYQE